jgi:hypothetical protein
MNSVSLNQIAYNLLNSLRGGRTSSSENIDLEQVKFAIKYYRSLFIRRDMQRNNLRSRMFEQDLGQVKLGSVDTAESAETVTGNHVLRTEKVIPTPIRLKNGIGITHVGGKDKQSLQMSMVDDVRSPWMQFGKYTKKTPFVTYRNGYLYVHNHTYLDRVNIRGMFEDPEQVHKFTRENGFDLYDEDSPFPISSDMLEGITKGLLQGELTLMLETQTDTTTDKLQSQ